MASEFISLPDGSLIEKKIYSKYTEDELKRVIKTCKNVKHVCITLQIHYSYGNHIKSFIESNKIDTSHFITNEKSRKIPIEDRLVEKSYNIKSDTIKRYLLKNKVKNECNICKMPPIWNNKLLNFQLDHINGDHHDNRIENLRLICPNCHTQTDTFTGKNTRTYIEKKCEECGKILHNENVTKKCIECLHKKDNCYLCKKNPRYKKSSRCKECYKIKREQKNCVICNKPITGSRNITDWHWKCKRYKGELKEPFSNSLENS